MKLALPVVWFVLLRQKEVAFQTKYFVQKELDIRGSRNALPADFRAVINYMKEGKCPVVRTDLKDCKTGRCFGGNERMGS